MWNEEKQMNWMKKRRGSNLEREEKRRERRLGPHSDENTELTSLPMIFVFVLLTAGVAATRWIKL